MADSRVIIGNRIKKLRENLGISRQQVAGHLAVDLTAVAAWEAGKYMPRENRRLRLAALLGTDIASLFAEHQEASSSVDAGLISSFYELSGAMGELLQETASTLRGFRLTGPYRTSSQLHDEFRAVVDRRLCDGSLEVERIEIFFSLERLQEVLSNLFRYEGRPYRVKTASTGVRDLVPAMSGYLFDGAGMIIGGYWAKPPSQSHLALRLKGEPFKSYFSGYWREIWNGSKPLGDEGGIDLDGIRHVAEGLGLGEADWPQFLDEARHLKMSDGLPPLI
jgi:transcriptional regulator with XRE-family HTH domain